MATGFTALDALNNITKAGVKEAPAAKFRTKDISIFKMYRNEKNFYSIAQIEELADDISRHGLKQNLEIKYAPCDKGEYVIIAGERRWEALKLLVSQGHNEFELATSKITAPKSDWEETLEIIIANAYRDKSEPELLEEEMRLKAVLQEVKAAGKTIPGYDLKHGKIRTIIAKIMKKSETKVQQYESIGTRLIPEYLEEFRNEKIGFSTAYELSTLTESEQRELHEKYSEDELSHKEVKTAKEEKKKSMVSESDTEKELIQEGETEKGEEPEAAGSQESREAAGGQEGQEGQEAAGTQPDAGFGGMNPPEEYVDPQPEKIISLCYSCKNFSECEEKSNTVKVCNAYINKAEAEKTEEQKYSEEQSRIDKETAARLREIAEEDKMKHLPSDTESGQKIHDVKLAAMFYGDTVSGRKPFELRKNDRNYRVGEILHEHECIDGEETGRVIVADIIYVLEDYTGLEDGYCILGIDVTEYDA